MAERTYWVLTARTRSLIKVQGGQNILRTYSRGKKSRIKSKEEIMFGELTARTRSLNTVLGGHNILRTYSKDKVLEQIPRRKLYLESLQQGRGSWTKTQEDKICIWRVYSKHKVPEQNPRKTEYMEALQQGQYFWPHKIQGGKNIRRAFL